MKKFPFIVLLVLAMLSCNNDDGIIISPGSEEIDLTINFIGLNLQSSDFSAKSTKNSTSQKISDWVHIFQADLSIKFTNKETLKVYSLAYNPANPAAGYKIILPFGVYDYKLESLGDAYANYIPFKAEGIIEINKLTATLDLVGVTQYGLVTVDKFHIISAVLQDTQLGVIQMPSSQEHFYKYVLSQKAPLVKITEDLLNTQPSYQLPSISSLVRYNLMLGINELSVISFILSDFQQEDIYVDIDQNAARTYVPDDNFEQKLIDLGYDNILDNYVLTSNIVNINNIDLANIGISDATGIEDFINLTGLHIYSNSLTSIDLSQNTKLFNLRIESNHLQSLDITNNPDLNYLFAELNDFTTLDLSKNLKLVHLALGGTAINNLDVTLNKNLVRLEVGNTLLSSLDVTKNTALIYLDLSNDNPNYNQHSISVIDLTKNPELIVLRTNNVSLGTIDLSNNSKLEQLEVRNTGISNLNVSNMTTLNMLFCELNSNLTCIQVNQTQLSQVPANWHKDPAASYSLNCN